MNRALGVCVSWMAVALWAGPSAAEPLPFEAELAIEFPTLTWTITAQTAGVTEVTPGAGGARFGLPAGIFAIAGTRSDLSIDGLNETGMFAPGTPDFGGPMGLGGTLGIFFSTWVLTSFSSIIFTGPYSSIPYTFFFPGPGISTTGQLQLDLTPLGSGGTAQATTTPTVGALISFPPRLSAQLAGDVWGTGVVQAGTGMRTGYDNRQANGVGAIQLVTPVLVSSGFHADLPAFGTLTITFAPEPSPGLLLVASAFTLAALAAARRSFRRPAFPGERTGRRRT
ncbi:MAG: hypothetical protein JSU66_00855 [Deltaproteobacteria bacterium]|nr:MAG: hypothetical protein JSU66_00855 [Deltaproteobacteria bacterium]